MHTYWHSGVHDYWPLYSYVYECEVYICNLSSTSNVCYRIDQRGVIKVADFGLTEDMYVRNYFRHDKSEGGSEEKVPIRWMAPESIESDIYNERTDVVRILWYYVKACAELWA